ncbi:hypothetical protein O3P69_004201 [Scylla paramamosain]|uniref:Uncharacterized protein n=1 Tax=Scylla paramamosain TaxID=85552 RepID=A0AAW0UGZ4_SCYPA
MDRLLSASLVAAAAPPGEIVVRLHVSGRERILRSRGSGGTEGEATGKKSVLACLCVPRGKSRGLGAEGGREPGRPAGREAGRLAELWETCRPDTLTSPHSLPSRRRSSRLLGSPRLA